MHKGRRKSAIDKSAKTVHCNTRTIFLYNMFQKNEAEKLTENSEEIRILTAAGLEVLLGESPGEDIRAWEGEKAIQGIRDSINEILRATIFWEERLEKIMKSGNGGEETVYQMATLSSVKLEQIRDSEERTPLEKLIVIETILDFRRELDKAIKAYESEDDEIQKTIKAFISDTDLRKGHAKKVMPISY